MAVVFLEVFGGKWLSSNLLLITSIILFTYPLFFETAGSAAASDALDQALDDVVDLGFLRHIELLAASLNLLFAVLNIGLAILWLFNRFWNINLSSDSVPSYRRIAILLTKLLLKHQRSCEHPAAAGISLISAHLALLQF